MGGILRGFVLVLLIVAPSVAPHSLDPPREVESPPVLPPRVDGDVRGFEANLGQFPPEVQYLARSQEGYVFFTAGGVVIGRYGNDGTPPLRPGGPSPGVVSHLRLDWAEKSPSTKLVASEPRQDRSNYFLGNDPMRWTRNVPHYGRLTYHALYPGIDAVFYANPEGRLEYDLVVAPGADPAQARLRWFDGPAPGLEPDGSLRFSLPTGALTLDAPYSYQDDREGRKSVPSRFVVADGYAVVDVGDYDARLPLVIDPVLGFSTYVGGNAEDTGAGIVAEDTFDPYMDFLQVAGSTLSTDFPDNDDYQSIKAANLDVFLVKWKTDGSAYVVWSYLGGNGNDVATAITPWDRYYPALVGYTTSTDFPVTAYAIQSAPQGGVDGFYTRFSLWVDEVWHSTYIGGTGSDYVTAIHAQNFHGTELHLVGDTDSPNLPVYKPSQASKSGGTDAFYMRFRTYSSSPFLYGTYLGGSGDDHATSVVGSYGSAFIAGYTQSTDFPLVQPTQGPAGGGDAFLTWVSGYDSNPLNIPFSTYLGGSGSEAGEVSVSKIDMQTLVTVAGSTTSTNFPTTPGALQTQLRGPKDAFVVQYDPWSWSLRYSTLYGGSGDEEAAGLSVDASSANVVVLAGRTSSADLPLVAPLDSTRGGANDGFVARIDIDGSRALMSTYHGGSADDEATAVSVQRGSRIFVVGTTWSSDLPLYKPFITTRRGTTDLFLLAIDTFNPTAPLNPRAVERASGTIRVTWDPPTSSGSSALAGYNILRSNGGGAVKIATVGPTTSYDDTALPTGTYRYFIQAFNADGIGPASTEALASTTSTYPGIPRDVRIEAGNVEGDLVVRWTAPTTDATLPTTAYRIYRSTQGTGPFSLVGETSGSERSFRDRYLAIGEYHYRVSAVTALEGSASSPKSLWTNGPLVVGFGDSVAAGYGLGPALGYPGSVDNERSYPMVVAQGLGGWAVNFAISGACSATAEGGDGAAGTSVRCHTSVRRQELDAFRQAVNSAPVLRRASVVTLNVGGNDIEFDQCLFQFVTDGLYPGDDPCAGLDLKDHLAAFETNLRNAILDIQREVSSDATIVVNRYYKLYPSGSETPCELWHITAAVRHGKRFGAGDHEAYRREVQVDMARYQELVVGQLNGVIERVVTALNNPNVRLATPTFTGHDSCSAERAGDTATAQAAQWLFRPTFDVVWSTPSTFVRYQQAALNTDCYVQDRTNDPPPTDLRWTWGGTLEIQFEARCMAHPTAAGQAEIARAVIAAIRR